MSAPNRKAVTETAVVTNEVPAWMRAKEGDSEKVKDKKRRALKAYKKKLKCGSFSQVARHRDCFMMRSSQQSLSAYIRTAPLAALVATDIRVCPGRSLRIRFSKSSAVLIMCCTCRFQKMDLSTKAQADNWKNFNSGKGSKKKSGFLSTGKKESMFSVPDNPHSKVGVIGSGSGMTGGPTKRTRLDF